MQKIPTVIDLICSEEQFSDNDLLDAFALQQMSEQQASQSAPKSGEESEQTTTSTEENK